MLQQPLRLSVLHPDAKCSTARPGCEQVNLLLQSAQLLQVSVGSLMQEVRFGRL